MEFNAKMAIQNYEAYLKALGEKRADIDRRVGMLANFLSPDDIKEAREFMSDSRCGWEIYVNNTGQPYVVGVTFKVRGASETGYVYDSSMGSAESMENRFVAEVHKRLEFLIQSAVKVWPFLPKKWKEFMEA